MTALTIRLLGAGLLALAGGLLGYEKTAELKRRQTCLRQLCGALGRMESELVALQTPLPQLLARLEECPFFLLVSAGFGGEPLERLWRRAAEVQPLPAADRQLLGELGSVIGRCDAQRQAAEIALTRQQLRERSAALEREMAERGRHFTGLGAALGAMLAAVLF